MEKFANNIRQNYKTIRDNIPLETRKQKSLEAQKQLMALLESDFKGANIFLCFYPFGSEIDLLGFYQTLLDHGKQLYFPVSDKKYYHLSFHRIYDLKQDFVSGTFGIMEPKEDCEELSFSAPRDIISITPGLIFDTNLNRIGYGAGFYDRFFKVHPDIKRIAVCYDEQIVPDLKDEIRPHDIPMNFIVTDNRVLKG